MKDFHWPDSTEMLHQATCQTHCPMRHLHSHRRDRKKLNQHLLIVFPHVFFIHVSLTNRSFFSISPISFLIIDDRVCHQEKKETAFSWGEEKWTSSMEQCEELSLSFLSVSHHLHQQLLWTHKANTHKLWRTPQINRWRKWHQRDMKKRRFYDTLSTSSVTETHAEVALQCHGGVTSCDTDGREMRLFLKTADQVTTCPVVVRARARRHATYFQNKCKSSTQTRSFRFPDTDLCSSS